ncbi:MAG: tRNA uridine-5-carboxymethylaminomethyl(34) synthesis enzyme MnmG [Ignavibacteriae bacterium]|nr:tRNA uridine-5-carboxymethylaminomethyl(34) synthesis enzyme MnmG [Ignavibacteriota bacterium]
MKKYFDIVVIGAGHAGVEASYAAARMGCTVGLVTMDVNAIGRMSCNPAIGGTAKGHLVREIDALGGIMGVIADRTGIQFKMLNTSKGPAVWSPRCQSDKELYSQEAARIIKEQEGIEIIQGTVKELQISNYKSQIFSEDSNFSKFKYTVSGIITENGEKIDCKSVIITSGTFLNAIMHTGKTNVAGGRIDEKAATGLSENMRSLGFETGRLKTGTPPRLEKSTIDFSVTEIQTGDTIPQQFSQKKMEGFPFQEQVDCYLTHTNTQTHEILRTGFEDSPMFTGRIKGVGPRYCPSIEDKISRFSDKPRHQIFLEPETLTGNTIYMNGFSTSLPIDVQQEAARTIPGLEKVNIVKQGYAVEYDFFPTHQIDLTLETKLVSGLYTAGQINGTSGYEEAAAQGLMAGINSVLKLKGKEPFILKRSEAYIGVLIDDLITKGVDEPYRMFTSCAEYRLILRQDNADLRLMKYGYELGLIDENMILDLKEKADLIWNGVEFLNSNTINQKYVNKYLRKINSSEISQGEFLKNLIRRSEVKLKELLELDCYKDNDLIQNILKNDEAMNQIEIEIKYKGYIDRQDEQISHFVKNEEIKIPVDFKYDKIRSLSTEAREKLKKIRPNSIGQAMRISGVRPSDISAVMVYMRG